MNSLASSQVTRLACYGEAGQPTVTDHESAFTGVAAALVDFSVLAQFLVLG